MTKFSKLMLCFSLLLLPLQSLASDDNYESLKRFGQVLDMVEEYYVREVPRAELIDGALQGMLQGLDPHSNLLLEKDFREMQESISGDFYGIGVEITTENGQLLVIAPIDDTPAAKAGLRAGDIIVAVDGALTQEMSLQESVNKLRGAKGSEVELLILRKSSQAPEVIKLKRDSIPITSVKSKELEKGYHWIRLTRFSERTTTELNEAIKEASKKGEIKGIILDLRNNPGGLFDQAVSVSDVFLDKGMIVSMRGRTEDTLREFQAKKQATDQTAPLVVLINAGTASSSEIVAGALQDQKRGLIVGEKSFGKGSVQNVIPINDKTGLKITVALYYTPSGKSIQAEGVIPDILVPFEMPREKNPNEIDLMFREENLKKHINNDDESKNKQENITGSKEILDLDNQLRLALQLVKSLPVIQEIK